MSIGLDSIYILLSIKTRIETIWQENWRAYYGRFISYYPLKQGLKPLEDNRPPRALNNLYPTIH